ncbi:hypothetical protein KEM14_gp63 [Xanthomonas virus phiXaf18]|uniref:Uncharacterized protein n=1 Tax=Xanthomonas virus phiXaf18 TaxID=2653651 RepID=A0A5P8PQM4_9CAUD|nr:hypothetical protein KEM14_gp63 [Xanthomonas virus phiXaf18]QFR59556.1 hypothetical protein phiXaf18_63 [Xanthomonas virus phiXaf18]
MSITDHVAILLHSSLDQPRAKKANPGKVEYYTNIALPPSAADDLAAQMREVAPNGNLSGLRPTIEPNGKKAKPHAGIPNDWLILRLSSGVDYPPDLFATDGQKVAALPVNGSQIRSEFYAGQRVRINGYPFFWNHTQSGARGVSWNLSGAMAVGGGERRGGSGGEPSESAFAKYRQDAAPAQQEHPPQPPVQQSSGGNPFQQGNAGASNPFG